MTLAYPPYQSSAALTHRPQKNGNPFLKVPNSERLGR